MKLLVPVLVAAALACTACEDKEKKSKSDDGGGTTAADHHTALVLDDGFDYSHDVFKDKIEAKYTITCDDSKQESIDVTKSFEDQKADMIAAYGKTESPCSIAEGIDFKAADDYSTVLADRESWNQQVLTKTITFEDDKIDSLRKVIGGQSANVNYHGTNTSGLIAYDNPDVKLVMIQYELRSPDEAAVEDKADCPKQPELDAWVKLHGDPDVLKAYMDSPLDDANAKLLEIQLKHKVTLVNLSLGTPPREELEKELKDSGCGDLDYLAYYTLEGKISHERDVARYEAGVYAGTEATLVVQAAGNSGAKIDGDADTNDCGDPEYGTVMVGAVDFDGKLTDFSNFGKCVQYYMMGRRVIVAAPEQFLDIADGTSFSAPLLVRYLSQNTEPGSTAQVKTAKLTEVAGSDQIFDKSTFPNELAFDDTTDKISAYALRGKHTPAVYSAFKYYELTHPGALK